MDPVALFRTLWRDRVRNAPIGRLKRAGNLDSRHGRAEAECRRFLVGGFILSGSALTISCTGIRAGDAYGLLAIAQNCRIGDKGTTPYIRVLMRVSSLY